MPGTVRVWHARSMAADRLGIVAYEGLHFGVENLERSKDFYTTKFDFKEVARAGDELVTRSGQRSIVFGAGDVRVCVSTALAPTSKVARFLRRHPSGIMSLNFRVESLADTMAFLEKRGGTFLADPVVDVDEQGGATARLKSRPPRRRGISLHRALGLWAVRAGIRCFRRRRGWRASPPNIFGIQVVDHVTSNGLTMQPIVAWYRDVLGFEPFWQVEFHTQDVAKQFAHGSGLRSIVMWDPVSRVKFATNEPLRPHFRDSQIYKFVEDNMGPGIQHVAFNVTSIVWTVEELKRRGVDFMDTPSAYYQDLPRRLEALGIHNVKEQLALLEKHRILLDGSQDRYMLQIFLREAKSLYGDERAGPFFYEIIQRCGDEGFGYGNFRALFESIERLQKGGKVEAQSPKEPA